MDKGQNIQNEKLADAADGQYRNKKVSDQLDGKKESADGPIIQGEKKQQPKKVSIKENSTFSWKYVGSWSMEDIKDKASALKTIKSIEVYVIDHLYGDWYWNSSIMIGTCFFAWLVARLGGGILSLGLVLICTTSVYKMEFRRFNRDIRDDMRRITASNRLENEVETMEWLNSFLDKFWVIYMPSLSEQVMFQANLVLKDSAPGFGIEALSLDEFTLGSKAPRINSIKSYTRKGRDHIEMDWAFSFAPNDTDDMTKNEIKRKINPKVALGVTVGKAFISKSLPVLVEDMSFTGRMNVKLKLCKNFPHVKIVSIQFLEAPTIDYALKPVGGDTFGIDIMSFIPGLSSFVNGLIHSNLRPMLYAPNSLDIDVEEIISQQTKESIGLVAVTINRLTKLKTSTETKPNSINPYVQLTISNNTDIDERTNVKKLINDPIYLETKYILVNQLDGNHLNFNVFHLVEDKVDDQLIGNVDFALADLLQKEIHTGVVKNIKEGGKNVGNIDFDIRYYPVLEPMVLEDGTKEPILDSEIGIVKINLHEAKDLDISGSVVGLLNPYAEIYINNELMKTFRKLRQNNEPTWDQSFESLITEQSSAQVQVLIKDSVEDAIVGKLDANLQDLTFETSRGQEWFTCPPIKENGPHTKIRITAGWKGLSIDDEKVVHTQFKASIGGLRVHLRSATGLKELEAVGKIDPYIRVLLNGKLKAKTSTNDNTTNPVFNSVFFFPVANEHQHLLLGIMDEEKEGKDRSLGSAAINVNDFLKKNDEGYFLAYDGSNEIIEQPIIYNGEQHGVLSYSVTFIPTLPVYTISQLQNMEAYFEELKQKEIKEAEQREREKKLLEEHPNEYEYIDIDDDIIPDPPKLELPLEKLIKYRAGNIVVHLSGGKFDKSDVYVHTLFDDQAYPSGVSPSSEGKTLKVSSVGEGFIRDLPNSKLILRIAKKVEVNDEKEIIAERIFDTIDILKKSYAKPINLNINDRNAVKVQLEFIPTAVKLAPFDTILDVGKMKLDILGAEDLMSVDQNGKSDPFLVIKLDGVEIFRTDKKRRTLSPHWNEAVEFPLLSRSREVILLEVYDWDLTHDDELIGTVNLDLSTIEPLSSTQFSVKLDTEGTVNLRATFRPEYIRPKLNSSTGLPIDLGAVAGVPLKVVGGAAGIAGNVVSGGVSLAADSVTKGGSFIKGFGRSKKKKNSPSPTSQQDETASTVDKPFSDEASGYSQQTGHTSSNQISPSSQHDAQKAPYNDEPQKPRSGASSSAHAPNIHAESLPPPQRPRVGHSRNFSTDTGNSSFANSIHGPDAIPGRISIISASGFSSSTLEVKAVLKTSTKEKEIYKSRPSKLEKSVGYKWNESAPFKATPDSEILFSIREHHKFGKNIEIARTALPLASALNNQENVSLPAGDGELTINIKYISIH